MRKWEKKDIEDQRLDAGVMGRRRQLVLVPYREKGGWLIVQKTRDGLRVTPGGERNETGKGESGKEV